MSFSTIKYTLTHIRSFLLLLLLAFIRRWFVCSFIPLHFACWFLLICSHIKCEIKYRQQRTFIKGPAITNANANEEKKIATITRIMMHTLFFTQTIYLNVKHSKQHIISIGRFCVSFVLSFSCWYSPSAGSFD